MDNSTLHGLTPFEFPDKEPPSIEHEVRDKPQEPPLKGVRPVRSAPRLVAYAVHCGLGVALRRRYEGGWLLYPHHLRCHIERNLRQLSM